MHIDRSKKVILVIIGIFLAGIAVLYSYNLMNVDKEEGIKYLIGVSQANLEEEWRLEVNRNISEEATKFIDMRVIYTDALNDSQKQINDISNLIKRGVDLLIISPNEVNALRDTISEANKTVPVIIMDREVPGSDYTMFIGADNKQIGIEAGKYVLDYLGPEGGNVIEVVGQEDSPVSIERSEGFRETINKNKNIKIIKTIIGDWMKDKTEDILKQMIFDLPKIDVVFAHNDEMALGAGLAARNMRIGNICYIGVGGLEGPEGGIQSVESGTLNCTFSNTTGGKKVVEYAIRILNGEKGLPKDVIIKSTMVSSDNIASLNTNSK